MKTQGAVEVYTYVFLTSTLHGNGQLHAQATSPWRKEPQVSIVYHEF
jgi:hypothetical protein